MSCLGSVYSRWRWLNRFDREVLINYPIKYWHWFLILARKMFEEFRHQALVCGLVTYLDMPTLPIPDHLTRKWDETKRSLVQIFFGVSAITAQIILILNDEDNGVVRYLVAGLWRGVFVGINGILGIAGGNKLISKMTKSFLLFSIISIISCASLFVISIAEATSLSTANLDIDVGTVYGLNILKAFMMGILSVAKTILATKILGSQAAPVWVINHAPGSSLWRQPLESMPSRILFILVSY